MPTHTESLAERPTFNQLRSCLPPRAQHSVLRLMPFGDRAPAQYLRLQECVYATLAPGLSSLVRAEALAVFWSLFDHSMPNVPDSEALLIEVAQHVCDTAFTFQAAEVLAVAELNTQNVYLDEGTVDGTAVSLPVLTEGRHGPLAPDKHVVPRFETVSHAMRELTGRSKDEIAAMPQAERLAAIRLLRLFLVYGRPAETSDTAAARELFFDRLGLVLWRALMSPGFEPDVDIHLYGQPAINRMRHALRAASSQEQEVEVESQFKGTGSATAETSSEVASHGQEVQPGLMHLIVREAFPPPRDREDREAMKPYERLRQPMPLAQLPTVGRLDQCRAELLKEFPWADNVIDAVFDELRARRLLGALALGFSPILLKGPAGSGKTRLARRMGEVLELPTHTLNLGGSTDAMAVLGTNRGWATAQPSPLLRTLLGGRATTLVILDEVDKPGNLSRNSPPLESALLPLLDPEEARRWRDGFLQVECDLRCLQWVMTCNDITWLSSAFKSRVRIHEVRRPTTAELRSVIDFAVRDLEVEWGLPAGAFVGVPISQMLPGRVSSLRELRKAVSRAVAAWAGGAARGPRH